MNVIGFCISVLLSIGIAFAFDVGILKHLPKLPEPKPGGLLDALKRPPKLPGVDIHISKGPGGFGAGASIGNFGFGFGFGGQYVPPGGGGSKVNLPPPPEDPYVPDDVEVDPYDRPKYIPDFTKPELKPPPSEEEEEEEEEKKGAPEKGGGGWPKWEDDENPKEGPYGDGGYPKHDSYEKEDEGKDEDPRPAWEDIGEADSKSENFMNGDLVDGGLIQPRQNKRRNRRFVESHVYHVPLLFRSNAKPFQVKVQSNPNSLTKTVS